MPLFPKASLSKSRILARAGSSGWPIVLLAALAFSLPFELDAPLLNLGPFAVTNVELILGLVLMTAVWQWFPGAKRPYLPRILWLWTGLFIITLLLATFLAPGYRENSLKASLRLIVGLLLAFFALPTLVTTWQSLKRVAWALLAAGFVAVLLGLVEYIQNRELIWLAAFRQQPTVAGAFIRLTGSFDYANQTAMYIEATLPFLLAAIWVVFQRSHRFSSHLVFRIILPLTLLFYLQAAFLTFSRASVATIALTGIFVALILTAGQTNITPTKKRLGLLWLGMTTAVVMLTLLNTQFNSLFRLRLQTEGDNEWYQADLNIPAIDQMRANEQRQIRVKVTNNGALSWHSDGVPPINLGARWIDAEQNLTYSEPRWPFARPIRPGDTIQMAVTIRAPAEPGAYDLIWDVVQEDVTWFGAKTGQYITRPVNVVPENRQTRSLMPPPAAGDWAYPLPIPDRRTLWQTAFVLFQQRPLWGIGPDNFRLVYGRELGASVWNETIHTNNWYMETAVSLGLLGSLVVFSGMLLLGVDIFRTLRQERLSIWQIALAAGIISFFIHGFLDFFLLFNSTGLLFWLLVGLWLTSRLTIPGTEARKVCDDANWI